MSHGTNFFLLLLVLIYLCTPDRALTKCVNIMTSLKSQKQGDTKTDVRV